MQRRTSFIPSTTGSSCGSIRKASNNPVIALSTRGYPPRLSTHWEKLCSSRNSYWRVGRRCIYAILRNEADTRYRIALAEGATSWQIVQALRSADFLNLDTDAVPDEGSLAPDSYKVADGSALSELIADRPTRQSELRSETPYNTYLIKGLPPTPIANPGLEAIEATLHPAQTEFIFFVANGTGGHAFSTTYNEHLANVAALRAIEASGGGN